MVDREELAEVYANYHHIVLATIRKQLGSDVDAEDIASSIFLDLCDEVLSGRFKHNCAIPTLLFVITRRRISDRKRKLRRNREVLMDPSVLDGMSEDAPQDRSSMYYRAGAALSKALGSQTQRDQRMILDFFELKMSRSDLAKKYLLSPTRVNSIIRRFLIVLELAGENK